MTLTESPQKNRQGSSGQKRVRVALTVFLVCCILILLALWDIGVFGGNVRVVVPKRVYRSAQITGHNLDSVLAEDHIRTVINLRGGSERDGWYRSELASCREVGADHVDVTLSARRFPSPTQLQKLLVAFDREPYPVLFHCQAGSDRSGLVGTLYLNIYQHVPLDKAESSQLTWRYGHISWGQTHAMDDFFNLYRQTNQGQDMRAWITNRYPQLYNALPANERA